MSFTTELQDLKTKIEALIAAGGIIEPALISQLAEINQALDTGGGGGGTSQATIEAAINAATDIEAIKTSLAAIEAKNRVTCNVKFAVAVRPANTDAYAAGDAFGAGGDAIVFDDRAMTNSVLVGIELYSAQGAVSGDLALILSENPFSGMVDNSAASSQINVEFQCIFPSTDWKLIAGFYRNRLEVVAPFNFYDPYRVYAQLIAMEAFTPIASQSVSVQLHFIDA